MDRSVPTKYIHLNRFYLNRLLKIHFPSSPERAEFVTVCEVILVKYLGLDLNIKTICVQLKSFECETVSCKVSSLHWIW